MKTISIIGYGKMSEAIVCGLNGKFNLEIIGRDENKMIKFIEKNNLLHATYNVVKNKEINIESKILILAIKPYALESFVYVNRAKVVYSILAGISIEHIKRVCSSDLYCRVMPNIASLIGKGISSIYLENDDFKELTIDIWRSVGDIVFLDKESLINPSSAIAGSGPAYLGLIAEALIDAGVREGLSLDISRKLVVGLFKGFGELLEYKDATNIRLDTTSPGGTTTEGVYILETAGVRGSIRKAVARVNKKAHKII